MSYPVILAAGEHTVTFHGPRPGIVCLCGSMRFYNQMLQVAATETAAGRIVIAPHVVVASGEQDSAAKADLDILHRRKIDLADEIVVVTDETNYIGESTRAEITYAVEHDKQVRHVRVTAEAVHA